MPTVTALRPESSGAQGSSGARGSSGAQGRDRVRVELDGAPWRTLPSAVVASAGLRVGRELDRPLAREVGRALRRGRALNAAGRALSRRDRSPAGLAAVLERGGIAASDRVDAVETLERLGYVDGERFAAGRAAALAARGYGDEAIRFDLEREGVPVDVVEASVAALEPELERARRAAERAGGGIKAARRLTAKGFPPEVAAAAAGLDES